MDNTESLLSTRNAFIVFSFTTSLFTLILSMVWEHLRDPVLSWITSKVPLPAHVVESMIVAPAVVIIPLTHVIGSVRYTHQTWISKPLQGGLTHIILQAVTWSLYSIALIVLGFAVFWRPGIFGLLSSAALLGLFAQGLMVTSLLTFEGPESSGRSRYASDNEIDDEAADEYDTSKMKVVKADTWASSPVKRKRSSAYVEHKKRKRKRDFLLWVLMNYGLLQTPYFLHWFYKTVMYTCVDCVSGEKSIRDVPAFFTLVATLGIPFFTHGIGGILFHGHKWSFHHPNAGGGVHVMSQAVGWTLVGVGASLQLFNLIFGTNFDFLLHSGNIIGWIAESFLLYSLLHFKQDAGGVKVEDLGGGKHRNFIEFAFSIGQDMFMTNMHWCFVLWFASAPFGFNLFSLNNPMEKLFKVTPLEGALNLLLVLFLCILPSLFFPYSAKRKPLDWKHPVSCLVKLAEIILVSPFGLFRDSMIVFEEDEEVYKETRCMFAIAPHGTLPLSVWALWHQRCDIFDKVCLFFGSQVGIVPGYRLWTGARGGCMTVTKKNLISVMETDNNVALVPGGVSEMLKCEPHSKNINVSIKHKGFVRIAIQQGFDLVPIVMLHENDMYNNPLRDFQLYCYKKFKVPVGLPYYTNKWFLPMSNQKPLRVVVGKRIKVKKMEIATEEQVEAIHRLFYEEVVRCFGKWKKPMGYDDRELTYVM